MLVIDTIHPKFMNRLNRKIKLGTLFSGIGAIEQAFLKLNIDHEIVFACDNGEREIKESREEIIEDRTKLDDLLASFTSDLKDIPDYKFDIDEL